MPKTPRNCLPKADLSADEPHELEPDDLESDELGPLDPDDEFWDAFLPDEFEPLPAEDDFWIEQDALPQGCSPVPARRD